MRRNITHGCKHIAFTATSSTAKYFNSRFLTWWNKVFCPTCRRNNLVYKCRKIHLSVQQHLIENVNKVAANSNLLKLVLTSIQTQHEICLWINFMTRSNSPELAHLAIKPSKSHLSQDSFKVQQAIKRA